MKDFFGKRTWILLLALGALVLLILLAAGLQGLSFSQPDALRLDQFLGSPDLKELEGLPAASWVRYLLPAMLALSLLLLLGPLRPMSGRDLFKALLRFALFVIFLLLVMGRIAQGSLTLNPAGEGAQAGPANLPADAPPAAFAPPQVSPAWEFWISVLVIALIGLILFFVFNHFIDRFLRRPQELDDIAGIARSALDDLAAPSPSKNDIIRCYTRMMSAVNQRRGIAREAAATPAEFALHLEMAGLPRTDIQGLTGLFERARYGAQELGSDEIKEARLCLTNILKACRTRR